MQIELIILFGIKTHGTIVAALNDVPGNAGNGQARSSGRGEDFVETEGRCLLAITVVLSPLIPSSSFFNLLT